MPGKVVLDSSVIAAVFFPERITTEAIGIVEQSGGITTDLAYVEVANVAWKRSVHAGNDPGRLKPMLDNAIAFIRETCDVIPALELIDPAWTIACRDSMTLYDALVVAAAVRGGAPLATADTKLAAAARKTCEVILIG